MSLIRLAYTSRLNPSVTEADIDGLAASAAAFNRDHGITGVLAIENRMVCQILEGPDAAVRALFASICRDPRHSGIVELTAHPIEAPYYEDWGMARTAMIDIVIMSLSAAA